MGRLAARLFGPPTAAPSGPTVPIGWGLGLVAVAYLLALPPSLNPADESVILYGAKRVLQGQALYRDFFDFLTPGAFYLYALAYAIGGVSITSAQVATALLNGLTVVCVYFLALRVAAIAEALLAALLVVALCVPVWNMASHHWIATTLAAATAAVLLAPRWQSSERGRPAAAGALAGVLVCTHQHRAVWLILWLLVSLPLLTLGRGGWHRCRRQLAWTAAGGAAVCVPIFAYAIWRASFGEMLYATVTWVMSNYREVNVGRVRWAGSLFPPTLAFTWVPLLRAMPALLGLEACSLLWAVWRGGLDAQRVRASLLLLAATASAGILYFPDVIHVAFVAPFGFVVIAGMIYRARRLRVFDRPAGRFAVRLAWAVVLGLALAQSWSNRQRAWQMTPVMTDSAFGRFAASARQASVLRDLWRVLPPPGDAPYPLFAYPGDAWLYLTLPADNPTPYSLLRPVYSTPEQTQTVIDLVERDPRIAVFVNVVFAKPEDPFILYVKQRFQPPIHLEALPYVVYLRPPS